MNNLTFTDIKEYNLYIEQSGYLYLLENDEAVVSIRLTENNQFDRASILVNRFNSNSYDKSLIIKHLKNFGIKGCGAFSIAGSSDWINSKIGQKIKAEFDTLDLITNDLKHFRRDSEHYPQIANSDLNIEHKRGKHANTTKCYVNLENIQGIACLYGFNNKFRKYVNLAVLMNAMFLDTLEYRFIEFKVASNRVIKFWDKTEDQVYKLSVIQSYQLGLEYCNDCGYWFNSSDTHIVDGYRYCKSCRSVLEYQIVSYGTKFENTAEGMKFIKLSPSGQIKAYSRQNEDDEMFGIELELQLRKKYLDDKNVSIKKIASDIQKDIKTSNGVPVFIATVDGSLTRNGNKGFELVSRPISFKAIQKLDLQNKLFRYKKYLKSLNNSNCGMHVHMSRNSFSPLGMVKVAKIIYENREFSRFIAQRTETDLNEWTPINRSQYENLIKEIVYQKDRDSFFKRGINTVFGGKYNALNFSKRNDEGLGVTIECRLFKSVMDNVFLRKNIEFLQALKEYSRVTSFKNVNINTFLGFVKSNYKSYENLNKFLNQNKQEMQQALQLDK
tara:strand:+ start:611 stop:2275 length:1665 start_codon:yes stop_codon:yes gene_type:complete